MADYNKNIKITADTSSAVKGVNDISKAEDNVSKSTANLRLELRSLQRELETVPKGSARWNEITDKAGEIRDRLGDIRNAVKATASDTQTLDVLGQAAGSIAAGFSIATSATALFGEQNKDLEKTLIKVEAAGNIVNGITTITNSLQKDAALGMALNRTATIGAAAAQELYAFVVGSSTVALKAFRAALISTGIGAVVVALGYMIANWDKLFRLVNSNTMAMKAYEVELNKIEIQREKMNAAYADTIAYMEDELALMQAQGVSANDLIQKQLQILAIKQQQAQAEADLSQQEYVTASNAWNNNQERIDLTKKILDLTEELKTAQSKVGAGMTTNEIELIKTDILDAKLELKKLQDSNEDYKKLQSADKTWTASQQAKQKAKDDSDALKAQDELNKTLSKNAALDDYRNKKAEESLHYQDLKKKATELQNKLDKESLDNATRLAELDKLNALNREMRLLQGSATGFDKNPFSELGTEALSNNLIKLTDNSGKYVDILKQISAVYEKQKEIIDQTALSEQAKYEKIIANSDKIIEVQKRVQQTQTGVVNEKDSQILAEKNLIASGGLTEVQVQEANQRITVLQRERSKAQQVLDDAASKQIQAATDRSNAEIAITDSKYQQDADLQSASVDYYLQMESTKTDIMKSEIAARMQAEESYSSAVKNLYSTTASAVSAIASTMGEKQHDMKNVLLVIEKGLQAGEVIVNTVKENSKLKQQAAKYSKDAAIYSGLSAAFAYLDPAASVSYGIAASSAASGAASSSAQIPINWGIAAASLATIAATTLTSWNRGSDSAGGGGAGGGGGATPQFNIVGSSSNNQLAAAIGAAQNQPVNAYVVGSDVTTQQALDRNRITNATFL
jgi:hypothetical protein